MSLGSPICFACSRYKLNGTCDAFPDRIPSGILQEGFDHRHPFDGDRGVRFELAHGQDELLAVYEDWTASSQAQSKATSPDGTGISARFVTWNLNSRAEPWAELAHLEGVDVALVQEAIRPPDAFEFTTVPDRHQVPWSTSGAARNFRTAVVDLAGRLPLREVPTAPLPDAGLDEVGVSLWGTLAAAVVDIPGEPEPITLVSVYGAWEGPVPYRESGWVYADASVHRVISDLAALISTQRGHRLIVAGDLNVLYGHGEAGSPYWHGRYDTVFDRIEALGLEFCGPQRDYPADAPARPAEVPAHSRNVATFRPRRNEPDSATRQLDFVFASTAIADRVRTWAWTNPDDWGSSDHCRVVIDLLAPPA